MKEFTLSQYALDDLKSIARYTEGQWGQVQRNVYLKQFDDTFHMFADRPSLGMACDFILQGYKKFPQGSHIIFYRTLTDGVIEITRVLLKSMDVKIT
jgi:toxin ParE1/3/4